MKKIMFFVIMFVLVFNYNVAFAKNNLERVIENIKSEKEIAQIINHLNIKPADFKSHAVIKISKDKFNLLTKNRTIISQNINLLQNDLVNNVISNEELNEIIIILNNNISNSYTNNNFIYSLKFKVLENNLPQNVFKNAINLIEQHTAFYGEMKPTQKSCLVPAVIAVVGFGTAMVAGAQYHTSSQNSANQPNVNNSDGSVTVIPYDNNGENIENSDGSVTIIPYNNDGNEEPR